MMKTPLTAMMLCVGLFACLPVDEATDHPNGPLDPTELVGKGDGTHKTVLWIGNSYTTLDDYVQVNVPGWVAGWADYYNDSTYNHLAAIPGKWLYHHALEGSYARQMLQQCGYDALVLQDHSKAQSHHSYQHHWANNAATLAAIARENCPDVKVYLYVTPALPDGWVEYGDDDLPLPYDQQPYPGDTCSYMQARMSGKAWDIAAAIGATVVQPPPTCSDIAYYYYPGDQHPSPEGQMRIAENLYHAIYTN